MRIGTFSLTALLAVLVVATTGCISEEQYNDLKAQNRIQQQQIAGMENELGSANLMLNQLQNQLDTCKSESGLGRGASGAEIAALENAIKEQEALIGQLQAQLLRMPGPLPPELNLKLQEFARNNNIVDFDKDTGILKFKSDLLFAPGSADVEAKAIAAIATLSGIMNSGNGTEFDIIIAGHTDNQPIRYSKASHPTNWHLSAHRAIGVLNIMSGKGIEARRLSVRGFGEFRPIAPNAPGNKGNAVNRRVEIYLVPKGM